MKTHEDLRKRYEEIQIEAANLRGGITDEIKKQLKKLQTEIRFIKPVMLYLEKIEDENSVKRQLELALKQKKSLEEQFEAEHNYKTEPNYKTKWMKDKGATKLNKQIKVCKYILE